MTIYEGDFLFLASDKRRWVHLSKGPRHSTSPLAFIESKGLHQCTIFVCGPSTQERREAIGAVVYDFKDLMRAELQNEACWSDLDTRENFVKSVPTLCTLEIKAYFGRDSLDDLKSTIAFRRVPDSNDISLESLGFDASTPDGHRDEEILLGGKTFAELDFEHTRFYSINNRIRDRLNMDDRHGRPCLRVSEMPASELRVFVQWDEPQTNAPPIPWQDIARRRHEHDKNRDEENKNKEKGRDDNIEQQQEEQKHEGGELKRQERGDLLALAEVDMEQPPEI